jgi:hypothetical protein
LSPNHSRDFEAIFGQGGGGGQCVAIAEQARQAWQ